MIATENLLRWTRRFGAHTAIVLAYLLDRARDQDYEWFTAPTEQLHRETGIRPETFLNARRKLERAGVLAVDYGGKGVANRYRLDTEALEALSHTP